MISSIKNKWNLYLKKRARTHRLASNGYKRHFFNPNKYTKGDDVYILKNENKLNVNGNNFIRLNSKSYKKTIKKLHKNVKDRNELHNDEIKQLKGTIAAKDDEIAQCKVEIQGVRTESLGKLQSMSLKHDTEKKALNYQIISLQGDVKAKTAIIDSNNKTIKKLQNDVLRYRTELEECRDELDEQTLLCEYNLGELQSRLKEIQSTCLNENDLKNCLLREENQKVQIAELTKGIDSLKHQTAFSQLQQLKKENESLIERMSQMQQYVDRQSNPSLLETIKRLERQNAHLAGLLKQKHPDCKNLRYNDHDDNDRIRK
jgi:hypothetical protein